MARATFEDYASYNLYLDQRDCWPSSDGEFIKIHEMPPRYAASALAKLLRWAGTVHAGVVLNISSLDNRREYVRNSRLGRALQAVASSQPVTKEVEQPVIEATPRDMILVFAPIIAEHTSLDITQIFKLAEALAIKADEEWTIAVPSR